MFWKFESLNSVISCIGGCQSEKSPFSVRYGDGQLYYEGECTVVTWINTREVWLRKEDGSKTKLYIRQLQKGKYRIRKSWNPTYQGQHFDLGYIESVEFQSILRQIVSACSNTCYMCNVFDAYNTRLWFHDMLLWQQWFLRMAIF